MVKASEIDIVAFKKAIKEDGYFIVENILDAATVKQLRAETLQAVDKEAAYHGTTQYRDYGVLQMAPIYGGSFLSLLENRDLMEPFTAVMGEGAIIYAYISSCMPPHLPNFSSRVHVDRPRLFKDYCECLTALVLLDDFTEENGCTMYLPGSHNRLHPPTEEEFNKNAKRLIAAAGTVFYFNLRLWHSGGLNKTDKWRCALAIGLVRPYLKQKFDLPAALKKYNVDTSHITDYAKQKLGYFAYPPATLDEFYGPAEQRPYREISEWVIAEREMMDGGL